MEFSIFSISISVLQIYDSFDMAFTTRCQRKKTDFKILLGSGNDQDGFMLHHINDSIGKLSVLFNQASTFRNMNIFI